MSRNLTRVWALLVLALTSEAWALGLGNIRLNSALNEPLSAEIELLSVIPEELGLLDVVLASSETFERYGLDRPLFLQEIVFRVVSSGGVEGNVVTITSLEPVTEPFITFLVEATWSRGRLLREYTLLLDPPTYTPPPDVGSTTAVTAPRQSTQVDSGRIERPPSSSTVPPPSRPAPSSFAPPSSPSFDTTAGGDYRVQHGETLWGITQRVRPDSRLTMNQTMLAIFDANPEAFAGNINMMRAGASLRIPSADDIFRIDRSNAFNEVRRQNTAWGGVTPDAGTQPSLVLVPPDDEQTGYDDGVRPPVAGAGDAATAERIRRLEQHIADQDSLIEIRDDELAALREELARLRGQEILEPDTVEDDVGARLADDDATIDTALEPMADDDAAIMEGDEDADAVDATEPETATTTAPPRVVTAPSRDEPGIVERVIDALFGFWGILIGGLLVVLGLLVWFARRSARSDDEESTGVWDALDADDLDGESLASTERLRALAREDDTAIIVVEEKTAPAPVESEEESTAETIEALAPPHEPVTAPEPLEAMGESVSLDDSFSGETAINLDASDPVAEADFHMAYGLYDQAADLINGALAVDPERTDLLSKLCEIYFVWGNRDSFIDAASRLHAVLGSDSSAEWDKNVIMGQQIAPDHEMFAGADAGMAATRSVDLSLEGALGEESELDMDFAPVAGDTADDVIDLGVGAGDEGLDFDTFGTSDAQESDTIESAPEVTAQMPQIEVTDATAEMATVEADLSDSTAEMPTAETSFADTDVAGEDAAGEDVAGETPTVEQPIQTLEETGELPSREGDEAGKVASLHEKAKPVDATAEIDLDDLGLDLEGIAEESFASDLDDTSEREALAATGENAVLDVGPEIDSSLLDATGQTQILSEDLTFETATDVDDGISDQDKTLLPTGFDDDDIVDNQIDDAETLLAPMDDDSEESTVLSDAEGDFDFAKTEALPEGVFTATDAEPDDLTAAFGVIEGGETIDQPRDDATIDQPRDDATIDQPGSGDLHDDDTRTMTEVGTKLDLARAYVDMGDPGGARSILEEVLDEGDDSQKQQAQQLLDSLPG